MDAHILKKNREALQGEAKLAEGAQSATMINSYKYKLARRAMIAMFDLSSTNLTTLAKDHWLRNAFNEIQLCLNASVVKGAPLDSPFKERKHRGGCHEELASKFRTLKVLQR